MKKRFWSMCALLTLFAGLSAAADDFNPTDMRLLRNPDIHRDTIVFVHGGDLWTVPATGGQARRLTSHVGSESQPKFSPDGKWIAFSGDYDGNNDVYVIPAEGGEPRRLTWHPLNDRVIDWEPDGKSIRFQSSRNSFSMREQQLWTVSLGGGLPKMINLPTGGLSDWSPDGKKLAYNRITRENRTWKRYEGGMAQNIWIYDFEANKTTKVTDWKGSENFPMWRGDKIFFNSDRNDKLQIWSYDTVSGDFEQITKNKTYDVKMPSEGPDSIVYESGGWLFVLDPVSRKSTRIKVQLNDDFFRTRMTWKDAQPRITGSAPGPDAKRAVFSARGELFTVPAEKGPVRNLSLTLGINEVNPEWSPDGKLIAYFSDRDGEYELYTRPGDGSGAEKQLTKGSDTYYFGSNWSPDSKKILVYDAARRMRWIDVESGKSQEISQGIDRPSFSVSWSPDSRWVAYRESEETGFGTIFLYSIESGVSTPVTTLFTDDDSPAFDPDGKYLYFTSARHFNPRQGNYSLMPIWTEQDGLYLVTLREDVAYPFPLESDEVEMEKEGDEDKKKDADKKDADKKDADMKDAEKKDEAEKKVENTVIDLDGIGNRIVALDVEPGNYSGLEAVSGKLFYMSRPAGADDGALMMFDMEEREVKTVLDKADGFDLTADGKSLFYTSNDSYGFVKAAADQKPAEKPLRVSEMQVKSDPRAEWKQMYLDAWRLEGDFFYDPGMHGVDWKGMYDRYAELVPYVTDRRDLDYVIGEMISELGAGHSYVRPTSERPRAERVQIGLLGCEFSIDGDRYRIVNILTQRDWNKDQRTPLHGPGIDVKEGDYLLAIDGIDLKTDVNPYTLLENKADQQVVLKLAGSKSGETRDVTVKPIESDIALRYVKWVEDNRRRVDEMSGGRIGYLHLPDTAFDGAQEFAKGYYAQTRKEALIIDERYNGGGFIPAFMMNIMNQKFLNMWKPRYGQNWRTPGFAFNGPMAMVSNAHAGSGGDALPYYFKEYKMGKMIGMRTWGGLVGYTTYIPLMDGGNVTFPEFGLYSLEGKWEVENHGVDPDIEVDNLPEMVLQGRDPQLEKAVAVLLEELKTQTDLPDAPKFPRDR